MNIDQAKNLLSKEIPDCIINKQYSGVIGGERIYAFIITIEQDHKTILIYEDGSICEITAPGIIRSILFSLEEV